MIYSVLIDAVNQEIEGEITLVVCGKKLTCFVSCLPFRVEVGETYQAELVPMVFDVYLVQEMPHAEPSLEREGRGYGYYAIGEMMGGCVNCGELSVGDEMLLSEFSYLEGKIVSWKIDRLDVAFV